MPAALDGGRSRKPTSSATVGAADGLPFARSDGRFRCRTRRIGPEVRRHFGIPNRHVLAYRGEADRAFEWLDKAVQYHDTDLGTLAVYPLFASLHSDPRWLPFLRKIGMAPEQLAAIKFDVKVPR